MTWPRQLTLRVLLLTPLQVSPSSGDLAAARLLGRLWLQIFRTTEGMRGSANSLFSFVFYLRDDAKIQRVREVIIVTSRRGFYRSCSGEVNGLWERRPW